jgi:hypothetical protein
MVTIKKDLRLWKASNSIIPFVTRGQKLAEDIMETLRMKASIIEHFKQGVVTKTNYINYHKVLQSEVTDQDKRIISDLEKNGLLVYHILMSYSLSGVIEEISSEFSVSTFGEVITKKSFLYVPIDIFQEAKAEGDAEEDSNRSDEIKNHIDHILSQSEIGNLNAFEVTSTGIETFCTVWVSKIIEDIVQVS